MSTLSLISRRFVLTLQPLALLGLFLTLLPAASAQDRESPRSQRNRAVRSESSEPRFRDLRNDDSFGTTLGSRGWDVPRSRASETYSPRYRRGDAIDLPVIREDAWGRDQRPSRPSPRYRDTGRSPFSDDAFGLGGIADEIPQSRGNRQRYRTRSERFDIPSDDRGDTDSYPTNRTNVQPRSRGGTPALGNSANELRSRNDAWKGVLQPAQELISRRYQDESVQNFVASVSADQSLSMYAETLQLISERHLEPPAPGRLVKRGLFNLLESMQNPEFLQVSRLRLTPDQFRQFEQLLVNQFANREVATVQDAVESLRLAMQLSQQSLGLNPVFVGVEFEYGAIEALDQFSSFVPPALDRTGSVAPSTQVVGIGVQVETEPKGLRVLRVLSGGPAAQAGLIANDLIVSVDGQGLAGRSLQSATGLITGPEGVPVNLAVIRPNGATASVVVPRRRVTVNSVMDVQMLTASTGYAKLESFDANSTSELQGVLTSLAAQGMKEFVLDLRGNPGGLLSTAIEIARLFVYEGVVVSTRGRHADDDSSEAGAAGAVWKMPLVVLVDHNSASASEILAAAIQENDRGLIIGTSTYGKGTVQTLFPLNVLGASVRLTTAKFYSPTGREMAGVGVEPDVFIEKATLALQPGQDAAIAEAVASLQRMGGQLQFGAAAPQKASNQVRVLSLKK